MASSLKKALNRFKRDSSPSTLTNDNSTASTAPQGKLFPHTDPLVDGDDCTHDCETCTIKLPAGFKIDEKQKLYGQVNGWSTHLLVATGKTDWVRDVADEKGSVMEAVGKAGTDLENGEVMLSASNMPVPNSSHLASGAEDTPTTLLLLPAFVFIDDVTPASVPKLLNDYVAKAQTNTTPLSLPAPMPPLSSSFSIRSCPHRYLILLCSQRTRDVRCGQSAPLLKKEFERHLRPLGLQRDLHDERPGGCGIYFISHVGGHKFSANIMIYRRADAAGVLHDGTEATEANGNATNGETSARLADLGAAQCIWIARVRPEDCENIVRYTLLQGKVVKPDRQLRGGFDRGKGLVSW